MDTFPPDTLQVIDSVCLILLGILLEAIRADVVICLN
jgi:hypothetical protein